MTDEKVIQMIDEYLQEPHSINKEWVEALQICKQALLKGNEIKTEEENHILSVIQGMGVLVDKEELIKALEYDRNQYEKGYADGRKESEEEIERLQGEIERLHKIADSYSVCFRKDLI